MQSFCRKISKRHSSARQQPSHTNGLAAGRTDHTQSTGNKRVTLLLYEPCGIRLLHSSYVKCCQCCTVVMLSHCCIIVISSHRCTVFMSSTVTATQQSHQVLSLPHIVMSSAVTAAQLVTSLSLLHSQSRHSLLHSQSCHCHCCMSLSPLHNILMSLSLLHSQSCHCHCCTVSHVTVTAAQLVMSLLLLYSQSCHCHCCTYTFTSPSPR